MFRFFSLPLHLHNKNVNVKSKTEPRCIVAERVAGVLLLVAGGLIYLLFRPRVLLMFLVADSMNAGGLVDCLRHMAADTTMPAFVVYSLPAGLWAASYVLIADSFTRTQPTAGRLLATAIVPALGLALEMMQWAGLLPGTADIADAVCYTVPYLVYLLTKKTK